MDDWEKRADAISGSLWGTAIGDALGLPYEGLSPRRAKHMLGPPDRYRFCFGLGMVSDDTDHALMTAVALLRARRKPDSPDDDAELAAVAKSGRWEGFRATKPWLHRSDESRNHFTLEWFEASLARQLKWWLASIPAGIGLATLRSIVRLWLGWSPTASGVFSAGNGPAMRAPILGTILDDLEDVKSFVRCSTRMTHTDPKAEYGALAVALAAHLAARDKEITGRRFLDIVAANLPSDAAELLSLLTKAVESVEAGESTKAYTISLGLKKGVTGYMYHTVPACIHVWLSFTDDFDHAIHCIIECGGDADTTAAIVGGIIGASVGAEAIPTSWKEKLSEPAFIFDMIGTVFNLPQPLAVRSLAHDFSCLRLLRNVFVFLPVVLFHGFRRLLPPY
jgi:ADP-ribosyl-[dinitrogen reductase] hydrolase